MKINVTMHKGQPVILFALLSVLLCGWVFSGTDVGQKVNTNTVLLSRDDYPSPREVADARKVIQEFAVSAESRKLQGIFLPQLPDVPTNVCRAVELAQKIKDADAAVDMAALFLRYARQADEIQGTGALVDGTNPIVRMLLLVLKPELPGDEVVSSSLAAWICRNRGRLAKSEYLNKEIGLYREVEKRSTMKYERMRREGEAKAHSGETPRSRKNVPQHKD